MKAAVMSFFQKKWVKPVIVVGAASLVAWGSWGWFTYEHTKREEIRKTPVQISEGCEAKFKKYGLKAGATYVSPYITQTTRKKVVMTGYSEEDVRAIQRGCMLVDDLQGQDAKSRANERWNSGRFIRGKHSSCDNCHMDLGDKHDEKGFPKLGSLPLGASWVNGDQYDRFTGLLVSYELRQFQCYINSANGYKPNVLDDIIRDTTAYSRWLSAALGLKLGVRYKEQGVDEVPTSATDKKGDDYVRGAALFKAKCVSCHGAGGEGIEDDTGRVLFPALAGRNSFNRQSRNNFFYTDTILPGFLYHNMPLHQEGTLTRQDARDISYYLATLPRPAGDKAGPMSALWNQVLMVALPPLVRGWEAINAPEGSKEQGEVK